MNENKSVIRLRIRHLALLAGLATVISLAGCAGQLPDPEATTTPAPAAAEAAPATEAAPAAEAAPAVEAVPAVEAAPAVEAEPALGPIPRDWQRCPAIAEIPASGDLLVVGDAHGDWEKLRALLVGAGVVERPAPARPEAAKWQAGNATLVFVGDFTGKCTQSLKVIDLLMELHKQAEKVGGQVIATMGNHEAEFLAPKKIVDGKPEWDKKTQTFQDELIAAGMNPKDVWLARGGERSRKLGRFLNCLPAAAASDRWFIAHAGSTEGRTFAELRQAIEEGVDDDGYRTAVLLDPDTGLLEARLKPEQDVWWQKLPESQKKSEHRLREYASELGVEHIVIGHQASEYTFNRDVVRKKARVFQLFDGTLYLTDVGMSRAQKGKKKSGKKTNGLSAGALLQVERGGEEQTVSVVCPDGRRRPLPPEGVSKGLRCKDRKRANACPKLP